MGMERIGKYARYAFIGLSIALLLWMWNAFLHNVIDPSEEDAAVIGVGSLWAFEMAALAGVVISKVKHRRKLENMSWPVWVPYFCTGFGW